MASTVLLIDDDISTIAAVRRLLSRQGHEVVLASSAADAAIAFGHNPPALIVLSPSVEGGSGKAILDELMQQPGATYTPVLLMGSALEGVDAPVVGLPLDGAAFMDLVQATLAAVGAMG